MEDTAGVGARVKRARKLARLTQEELAEHADGVSLSLLQKVERGARPASPGFVAAVARALNVGVDTLYGQPYAPGTTADHQLHAVIPPLRRELAAYRLVPDGPPRPLNDLAADVRRAGKLRHSVSLDALGAELPGVLADLRVAAHHYTGSDRERVYRLLAEAYAAAGQVAWKLGYTDLSTLCTERIEWAAQLAGDPLTIAVADWYRAGELNAAAEWRAALAFLDNTRARIADDVRHGGEPALAVYGLLHLKSALAAARAGDLATSDTHLAEARHVAQHVTPGSDHYRLAFDQGNVSVYEVACAVEALDGTTAVKRASLWTPPPTLPRERLGHHFIDLARGYQLHGDRRGAMACLQRARDVAPLQARYHPQVHETIRHLVEVERRRSEPLARYARWAGVQV